jgi:hypothetical protein
MWNAKGDERAKGYRAYKELDRKYQLAADEVRRLREELSHKEETIRNLARELAGLPGMAELAPTEPESSTRRVEAVPNRPTVVRRITRPLSEVIGGGQK